MMNEPLKKTITDYKFLLTTILMILPIFLMIMFYFWDRETREFSYEITSFNRLISVPDVLTTNNLSVQLNNKPVQDPIYTLIKLTNSGNTSIKTNDFETPVIITFEKGVKILDVSVSQKGNLFKNVKYSYDDNEVKLEPTLFNPEDYLDLNILTSKTEKLPEVFSRIVGINSIHLIDTESKIKRKGYMYIILGYTLMLFYFLFSLTFYMKRVGKYKDLWEINFFWGVIGSIIIGISSVEYLKIGHNFLNRSLFSGENILINSIIFITFIIINLIRIIIRSRLQDKTS